MNWGLPTLTSLYSDFLAYLNDRTDALVFMLDPATVTATALPTNARRYNAANRRWELNTGATWIEMEANYNISADRLNGQAASFYTDIPARLGYTPLNLTGGTISGGLTVQGDFIVDSYNGRTAQKSASLTYVMCDTDLSNSVRWYEGVAPFRGAYINLSTCAAGANSAIWHTGNFDPATKQNLLSFTPVQQGTGTSQGANAVKIGWDVSVVPAQRLRVQIDATDFGNTWPINIAGNAATATTASTAVSKTETADQTMAGALIGEPSTGNIANASAVHTGLATVAAGATHDAFHSFLVPGVFGVNFGLDRATNQLAVGGWSLGAAKYRLWTEQNFDPTTKMGVGFTALTIENVNVDNSGSPLASTVGYYLVSASLSQPTNLTLRLTRVWDVVPVSDGGD